MPAGEEMFKFHGYSGPCPKPPLPRTHGAIDEIAAERRRQIESEGWTAEHDDKHELGEMACAAACYALAGGVAQSSWLREIISRIFPWEMRWWKPIDRRRDLIKAGALIVAEIERLDRSAAK
jgi:hypothetical protein